MTALASNGSSAAVPGSFALERLHALAGIPPSHPPGPVGSAQGVGFALLENVIMREGAMANP